MSMKINTIMHMNYEGGDENNMDVKVDNETMGGMKNCEHGHKDDIERSRPQTWRQGTLPWRSPRPWTGL